MLTRHQALCQVLSINDLMYSSQFPSGVGIIDEKTEAYRLKYFAQSHTRGQGLNARLFDFQTNAVTEKNGVLWESGKGK